MPPVSPTKLEALRCRLEALGISENDLEERFIHGQGSGGQKVNKTSSTVQLKHLPSQIEVKVQASRSQALNRYVARMRLADKMEERKLGKSSCRQKNLFKLRRQKQRRYRRATAKLAALPAPPAHSEETAPMKNEPTPLPVIGITLGDPAGVGSEITAKLLAREALTEVAIPLVIGDRRVLDQGASIGQTPLNIISLEQIDRPLQAGHAYLLDMKNISLDAYTLGQVNAACGFASGQYIEKGVALALEGTIDALVTNPIHKEAFAMGGYGIQYPGHTEMLAALTGTKRYAMMLISGALRVAHVTTHVSLLHALKHHIKTARILDAVTLTAEACIKLGIKSPRIGVAGINPHAGEHGLFGDEELREISPAIEAALKLGLHVEGPIPADTLFCKGLGGMYDAVVAMYHDQGHIPVKLAGFKYHHESEHWDMSGVNVTLGLPVIRTSVDHGTAFDKAGKGIANHRSLLEAVQVAIQMAQGQRKVAHSKHAPPKASSII